MTVWLAPELAIYDEMSECDFIGTIALDSKTAEASMNAISIIPLHIRKLESEPSITEEDQPPIE